MKLRLFLYRAYPILIPLYLLPISILYTQVNSSLVFYFGFVPFIFGLQNPMLLLKEVLKNMGVGYKVNSIDEQYLEYKKTVEEILKKHGLNYDVEIIDDKMRNMYVGISSIYITKDSELLHFLRQ